MMFKKSKSKSTTQIESKESINSGQYNQENNGDHFLPSGSLDRLDDRFSFNTAKRNRAFSLNFLGMIQDVNLGGTRRHLDVQLIDKVEEAQLEGKLNILAKDERQVNLVISKRGVTVYDINYREVFQRHPLHTVAQIVHYQDSFYNHNLAIKIGQVGRTVYHVFLFQARSEEDAFGVCTSLGQVFQTITTGKPSS